VVPNGSNFVSTLLSFDSSLVNGWRSCSVESNVNTATSSCPSRKLREDRVVRLPRHRHLGAHRHAAAHVDEKGQAERRLPIGPEGENLSHFPVVANLEVGGREAAHDPAASVADGGLDRHDVRPRL
jgi:hypothetical protein